MEMKLNGMRVKAVIAACAMLLSLTLTSCTLPLREAAIETSFAGSDAAVPVVSGFINSASINNKLQSEFLPAAEQMKRITDDTDGRLHVEYRMFDIDGGLFNPIHRITMYLSDESNSIELKTVEISGFDTVKASGTADFAWLHSAEIAESAFDFMRLGIEFDKSVLSENSNEQYAVEIFLKMYEGLAGKEIDVSDVVIESDDTSKKAYLMGLIDYYDDTLYHYDGIANIYNVLNIAAKTLTNVERDVYGRQSETVTGEEFASLLRLMHSMSRVHPVEGSNKNWSDLAKVDTDAILETMEMTGKAFTRRDAAEFVGRITKTGPKYNLKYSDRNLERIEDAYDSIWVRRAVTHGFMNYYGDSTLFAPGEGLTLVNAISSAKCYVNTRYNDWISSVEYAWDGNYTNEDVIISAAKLAEYFSDRPDSDKEFEVKTVINDRDYNWFYSQKNTGEYSAVNCMPSIATMASHWYDRNSTATVKKMRATSTYSDGWTAYELRCGLTAYNVPYTVEDAKMENIVNALDNGSIVLAQYSDRPYGISGHCYVIYGYRRFKDSTTFIVNDSDSLTTRAELFGRKMGNGDEVEGSFSMWTISRFVDDVTVIAE